jgi:N-sulfoglucosamine sulfohydrolase
LLEGKELATEPVFTEKTHFHFYDPMRGIRTNKFKYIKNFEFGRQTENMAGHIHTDMFRELDNRYAKGHPEDELYDVENDPDELNNLAGESEYAGIKDTLEHKLCEWMKKTQDPLLEKPIPSPFYERIIARFKNFNQDIIE